MPKERVATGSGPFEIDVVWRRGQFAQLGVVIQDSDTSKLVIHDGTGEEFDSLWADLTVSDVDRLQKVLRRVKRQLLEVPDMLKDEQYKPLK